MGPVLSISYNSMFIMNDKGQECGGRAAYSWVVGRFECSPLEMLDRLHENLFIFDVVPYAVTTACRGPL